MRPTVRGLIQLFKEPPDRNLLQQPALRQERERILHVSLPKTKRSRAIIVALHWEELATHLAQTLKKPSSMGGDVAQQVSTPTRKQRATSMREMCATEWLTMERVMTER